MERTALVPAPRFREPEALRQALRYLAPLSYRQQHASITLREALREHRAHIPFVVDVPEEPETELEELFAAHDAVHCLFGLGTTAAEEILVDVYCMVATTLDWKRYIAYVTHPTVAAVIWESTTLASVPAALVSLARIPVVWLRTRRSETWDFDGWRAHLDRPLAEIREEFGIVVDGTGPSLTAP
jgi:hypothetical protein